MLHIKGLTAPPHVRRRVHRADRSVPLRYGAAILGARAAWPEPLLKVAAQSFARTRALVGTAAALGAATCRRADVCAFVCAPRVARRRTNAPTPTQGGVSYMYALRAMVAEHQSPAPRSVCPSPSVARVSARARRARLSRFRVGGSGGGGVRMRSIPRHATPRRVSVSTGTPMCGRSGCVCVCVSVCAEGATYVRDRRKKCC